MTMGSMTDQGTQTSEVGVQTLDISQVKSIQLSDGWHDVENCEIVPNGFALGQSHSPLGIAQFYGQAIKYRNRFGNPTWTPLAHVLSFSTGSSAEGQGKETPYTDRSGSLSRS